MPTTRLSSKGQVVIPKSVREAHDWEPGQEFDVIEADDGVVLRPKKPFPVTTIDEVAGCLDYDGPPVPVEKMHGGYALRKNANAKTKGVDDSPRHERHCAFSHAR